MKMFVGLDISLEKTAVCVEDDKGTVIWEKKVGSDPGSLVAALRPWKGDIALVGLEACPLSEWIYTGLVDDGFEARCIETRHAQRFLSTRPNKTDKSDARGIADMMRLGHFRPVHVKSKQVIYLRTLLAGRKQLLGAAVKIEGTIRGLLRIYGLKVGEVHRNKFAERIAELIAEIPALSVAIDPLLSARKVMREQLRRFDYALEKLASSDDICLRLMTIPGVGPITALAFKATIDDPKRFATSKAVGAPLGLTPRVFQSGEIDHSGGISRCGDVMMRYYMYEAAHAFLSRTKGWSALKAWGVRLAKRHGYKRARVAVARKLAIVMHRMWVRGETFRFSSEPEVAAMA
jgi:transposase